MKHLLLLAAALLIVPAASAQWTYESEFPADLSTPTPNIHGLGVTPDGNVWIMPFSSTGDSVSVSPVPVGDTDCNETTGRCRVVSLHVLRPDGTPTSFSPITTVTLPGGEQDTLGGGLNPDGTWSINTGRGIRVGPDGTVYAVYFDTVFKLGPDGSALDRVKPTGVDERGLTAPGVDNNSNMFITGVWEQDPLKIYDANLDFVEDVVAADGGFNRTILALPDGNTVISPNYSADIGTIYSRPDEFTPWDSTGAVFEGMSVESIAIHPTTGNIWASAGSPNDPPLPPYEAHTWYEFATADVLDGDPLTPLASFTWNNPGDGRPRAIAFSPDGATAYVGEFSLNGSALQKFVNTGTAVENGPGIEGVRLHQNMPNPFHGSTEITFELDEAATVALRVYDVTGREVALLASGLRTSGTHTATFEASGLAGGVYVFTLEVDGQSTSRRMLHMR